MALVVAALVGAGAGYVAGGTAAGSGSHKTPYTPESREFWLFTVVLPFDDSVAGMPSHDYFAPDTMLVCKGDTLQIHFFNTEEEPENHTFTMEAPFVMNHELPFNATTTFSLTANATGSFAYRCVYHQPTMTGWLTVRDCSA